MKKKILIVLMAVALLSAATAGIGKAYAYFTANTMAAGNKQISLGDKTTIEEEYESWVKKVRIKNSEDSSQAVYVRAMAYVGAEYTLNISGWSGSDGTGSGDGDYGYFYYSDPVEPGKPTETPLEVRIIGANGEKLDPKSFNVVIVYETTPAVQDGTDANGNVQYLPADWSLTITEKGGENS